MDLWTFHLDEEFDNYFFQFTIKQEEPREDEFKPLVSTIIQQVGFGREISSTETSSSLINEIKKEKSDLWLPWDNNQKNEPAVSTSVEDTSDKNVVPRQESVIKVKC